MRLSQRLFAAFLFVIAVLVALVVWMVDRRLDNRLLEQTGTALEREAQLVGSIWTPGRNADSLANAIGALLGHRVTLIDSTGTVVGDSEFDGPALGKLENHADRPEVRAARARGTGRAVRASASAGDREIYTAVRHALGVSRVSLSTASHARAVRETERDILIAAALAALAALLIAALIARSISQPILELRDDAQAIAAGDLARRPSLSAPGEVGELATAFQRLTEQLSGRVKALEADDALLRAVSDALNEGVVAVDAREQVVHINDGARALLQVKHTAPFTSDYLPRDQALRSAMRQAMTGTATDNVETHLLGRNVTLAARPLLGGGAVIALADVTRLRRLESVRRDFVANVSHELKTPLTVVTGFAETLRDNAVDPAQQREFAATILKNAHRMQRLVDDLLDLSRIESGGWRPAPEILQIDELATEALDGIAGGAQQRSIALLRDIAPNARTLTGDAMAVRQILSNLTNNALRHTTAGNITVFSRWAAGAVELGVRDTGAGISAEHLPRVFERFYRADSARARAEGGTGLGLAIVKHLVEAHGGTVRAESTVGQGTTITATFPSAG